jgi:hypothetical protein
MTALSKKCLPECTPSIRQGGVVACETDGDPDELHAIASVLFREVKSTSTRTSKQFVTSDALLARL